MIPVVVLDILPPGLEFLQPGWWLVHIASVALVYVYAYRKGRKDERRRPPPKDSDKA